tara:strand:- start:149 stop:574 length:426 start_codon:yes stop_codon:yes gene_type:complete
MKKIVTLVLLFMMFACASNAVESERKVLRQKVLAFAFLSEYHHQLHIMIGEEEGDKLQAFTEFKEASILQTNMELIPVKNALERINDVKLDHVNVKRLDDLVDYYQSGLSIQIEAILRGYGHKEVFEMGTVMDLYDNLVNE